MPSIVTAGAHKSNCHGSGQLAEASRAMVAALLSTVAQSRRRAEDERSTFANTQATLGEADLPLQAAKLQFGLTSINRASPWLRPM
jgi:hypothetical protein